VAYLLAAKLKLRGYNVIQVTGVEAPRLCATRESALKLQKNLPTDTLRIENDVDPVPFLPPFGYSVGNKLYLVDSIRKAAYLPFYSRSASADPIDKKNFKNWTDSVFINARLWEIISKRGKSHRVPYIVKQLEHAFQIDTP
jgi:hypothetical protein